MTGAIIKIRFIRSEDPLICFRKKKSKEHTLENVILFYTVDNKVSQNI